MKVAARSRQQFQRLRRFREHQFPLLASPSYHYFLLIPPRLEYLPQILMFSFSRHASNRRRRFQQRRLTPRCQRFHMTPHGARAAGDSATSVSARLRWSAGHYASSAACRRRWSFIFYAQRWLPLIRARSRQSRMRHILCRYRENKLSLRYITPRIMIVECFDTLIITLFRPAVSFIFGRFHDVVLSALGQRKSLTPGSCSHRAFQQHRDCRPMRTPQYYRQRAQCHGFPHFKYYTSCESIRRLLLAALRNYGRAYVDASLAARGTFLTNSPSIAMRLLICREMRTSRHQAFSPMLFALPPTCRRISRRRAETANEARPHFRHAPRNFHAHASLCIRCRTPVDCFTKPPPNRARVRG